MCFWEIPIISNMIMVASFVVYPLKSSAHVESNENPYRTQKYADCGYLLNRGENSRPHTSGRKMCSCFSEKYLHFWQFLRLPISILFLKASYFIKMNSIYSNTSYAICKENSFFLTWYQVPLTELFFRDLLQLNKFAFHEIKQQI